MFQFWNIRRQKMTEPKPTATQCQQAAMKALAQADALVIQARKHLEELSPLLEVFPPDRPADRARKLEITEIMSAHKAPALIPETPDRKRRRLRFEELKFKKEHDDLNWTEALQEEFRPLVDEFFNF